MCFNVWASKAYLNSRAKLKPTWVFEQVISYILATGTGAAFGATIDLKEASGVGSKFFDKGSAAATFILFAFLFTAVSSVFSSLALSKKL